jgi:FKBP-type peptidyl-prolyl cis-trans isomerase
MKAQQAEAGLAGEAGKKFLDENAKKAGVKTTASGLQYEIMKEGTGPKPLATDTVIVHYHGTTIEGKVFDSSVDRKEPAKFPVNQVIPGWTEALQLMPVGSKWKLVIPSALAYGERGAGADIKPNAVLVFEVELLEIKK